MAAERDDLLRDIELAEQQLAEGQGIPHEQAWEQILEALEGHCEPSRTTTPAGRHIAPREKPP